MHAGRSRGIAIVRSSRLIGSAEEDAGCKKENAKRCKTEKAKRRARYWLFSFPSLLFTLLQISGITAYHA